MNLLITILAIVGALAVVAFAFIAFLAYVSSRATGYEPGDGCVDRDSWKDSL